MSRGDALTWRDVVAPNLGTAIDGTSVAADLFSKAAAGLSGGLGDFHAAQQGHAADAYAAAMARYGDPDKLAAAMAADPTLGVAGPLTAAALATGSGRVSTLLDQAGKRITNAGDVIANNTAQDTLDYNKFAHSITERDQANIDAAQPDLAKAFALNQSGDNKGAAAIMAGSASISKLSPDQLIRAYSSGTDLTKGTIGLDTSRLGNIQTGVNIAGEKQRQDQSAKIFADNQVDRNEARAGMDFAQKYIGASRNADDALYLLNNDIDFQKLSGPAQAATRQAIAAQFGSGSGGGSFIAGAGGGNAATMTYGGGQLPDSVRTLGDAVNYGKNVLIPQTRGKIGQGDLGTSAMGTYQITQGTLSQYAPKALGAGWKDLPMNQQNQDKIAEAIFNANNKSAQSLQNQWASLTPDKAQSLVGKSWAEARNTIAAGETGSRPGDPVAISGVTGLISNYLQQKQTESNNADISGALPSTYGDNRNLAQVANDLSQNDLKGNDVENIKRNLDNIRDRTASMGSKISYAQAGEILKRNQSQKHWFAGFDPFISDKAYDDNKSINWDGVNNDIAALKDNGHGKIAVDEASLSQQRDTATASLQAYGQAYQQAAANFQQLQIQAQDNPRLAPQLVRAQRDMMLARNQFALAQSTAAKLSR